MKTSHPPHEYKILLTHAFRTHSPIHVLSIMFLCRKKASCSSQEEARHRDHTFSPNYRYFGQARYCSSSRRRQGSSSTGRNKRIYTTFVLSHLSPCRCCPYSSEDTKLMLAHQHKVGASRLLVA
ncbi:hypothetical protein PAXRUDRAFT_324424 [Paxillus rubicundulus Ve08.2h10]|uniref:Uncharacterized protein n=1 Tax=Paxillus rubicundulus Ve08.2h10 TaxID=930991 RepID=A0A0D0E4N7_9AGAM|nr:hypothetical protein PAXRUDRAFT_324424 [Paxillus rubicundulus Ve08.2h10]